MAVLKSCYHLMENAFLKLPFLFSEDRLLRDLNYCQSYQFTSHFNTNDYSGDWKSIALRSLNGEVNQIYAHSSGSENYKNTPLLDNCPYFREVIAFFECEKESIRLLNLSPNGKIKEHRDHNLGYEDNSFRIHIPITTNNNVLFYINNQKVTMSVGESWYGNFNLPHWVENNGTTDRIHLIIDCIRNEWSDELFLQSGYNFELENKPPQYSKETKLRMIEELKKMNSETSIALINQLESEL
ncbi:aspartyl/asparaginyl beta-hydroxylase domain-containing protein [Aquimarina sediminis]|uniref:aspartyl/asparaginyl beta-hydroxylase domain-containing protein n=1 Tax=Aquimarina sediminis TaxID=2070536 RepID=UPI001F4D3A35|nr:aspartyl/asparaginyl beta-hydroxylase domain-containing protein [Aquimarina sediminis]